MMSHTEKDKESTQQSRNPPAQRSSRSLFAVPTPVKQLFDIFPLLTYPVNDLPQRAPQRRDEHVLYIFTSEDGALKGLPSCNPACLKWQARAPSDAIQHPTYTVTGIPQVFQHRFSDSLGKQPCIAEWCSSFRTTRFA